MEKNLTVQENKIEGRNAVMEALRSGRSVDKLFVLDGCQDGPVRSIIRAARKGDTIINFVEKSRLDQLSETGHHQGVIAYAAGLLVHAGSINNKWIPVICCIAGGIFGWRGFPRICFFRCVTTSGQCND